MAIGRPVDLEDDLDRMIVVALDGAVCRRAADLRCADACRSLGFRSLGFRVLGV